MNTYEPFNPRRRAVFAVASTATSAVVFAAVLLLFDRASRFEEPVLAHAPAATPLVLAQAKPASPAPMSSPAPAVPIAVAANGSAAALVADAACAASDAPATCAPPWGLNP